MMRLNLQIIGSDILISDCSESPTLHSLSTMHLEIITPVSRKGRKTTWSDTKQSLYNHRSFFAKLKCAFCPFVIVNFIGVVL